MTSPADTKDPINRFWRYGDLGSRVEVLSNPTGWADRDVDRRWGNWRKFLQLRTEPQTFVDGLSAPQKRSAIILFDWYTGSYQTDNERKFSATFLDGEDPEGGEAIVKEPLLRRAGSEYQQWMLRLFFHEFGIDSWEIQRKKRGGRLLDYQMCWNCRRNASMHAAAQQLAFSVLHSGTPSPDVDLGRRLLGGSSLENCLWLADKNLEEENPTFLWDIEEKTTVKVEKLGHCPPYTCISHTWGRLTKGTTAKVEGVDDWEVPQVKNYNVEDLPKLFQKQKWKTKYLWFDLFCIPQDEKGASLKDREVSRQAIIFGRCQECVVWLNDIESSWDVVQQALRWLSAKYFAGNHGRSPIQSKAAFILTELRNLPQAGNIELLTTPHEPIPIKKYALWFSSTWTLQETFLCPHMVLVNKHWQPISGANGCMIPLNSLINLLKRVESGLWDTNLDLDNGARPVKQLLEWLDHTYLDTLLHPSQAGILSLGSSRECKRDREVAVMSVLDVLDWHERRGNLEKTRKLPKEEGKLIRGAYFYEFIQEAAQKIGPQFYNFISERINAIDDYFESPVFGTMMPFSTGFKAKPRNKGTEDIKAMVLGVKSNQESAEKTKATVLESIFEKEGTNEIMPVVNGHPSVMSWDIQHDGQVRIRSGGVVASVDSTGRHEYACANTVHFSMISHVYGARGFESLNNLLTQVCTIRDQPSWIRPSYIVSLFCHESSWIHYCALLQGKAIEKKDDLLQPGTLELVRTALLHSQNYVPLPPTTEVDWIVL